MRKFLSPKGKRRIFILFAGLFLFLGSVTYLQIRLTSPPDVWHDGKQLLLDLQSETEELPGAHHRLSATTRNPEGCPASAGNPHKATYDVSEMASSLKMADLNWDGDVGVWDPEIEQRFQADLNSTRETNRQLKVFLVPFSHSDPGWLMTVDQYLKLYTQKTLHLMLERLIKWPDMTFIWAEVSFFKMWWETLEETKRKDVQKLVKQGRLEIVNGGYVMPDEATRHYYAIIHQYIYGHQWLQENLNITPNHGFSIDPFGHSSTMPYILKNLGFESMFIQRVHYILRKRLLHDKASQFFWQQPWDTKNSESMFCYLSHATLYDVKHTCGVDSYACSQFDYQYQIDKSEVPDAARRLLEQFRKYAYMYPHDAVLVPLGMDFRWSNTFEWESKYGNFHLIMDYLNKDPANRINIMFGTYKNYYDEVFKQMGKPAEWYNLPSITGDFFPYADRTVEYWTGYFTSHPYQKALSRSLERNVRTAELLYSLTMLKKISLDSAKLLDYIDHATRAVGLFQHHDAITGTSKQAVSDDYEKRLLDGMKKISVVIPYLASALYWPGDPGREAFVMNTEINEKTLPSKVLIKVKDYSDSRRITVFNSLASKRRAAVDLFVDTEHVAITDINGHNVPYQTSFMLDPQQYNGESLGNGVRVTFFVNFDSLGFHSFTIRKVDPAMTAAKGQHFTKISDKTTPGFKYTEPIVLGNRYFRAEFSPLTGLLQSIINIPTNVKKLVREEFKRYETVRSGAYLFFPSGIADMQPYQHDVRLLEGPLFSEVHTVLPGLLCQVVRIFHTDGDLGKFLDIENTHSLTAETNLEAAMRFSTDLNNNLTFFTDSNGFQMTKRRASHDLPMQANYYPATTMTFLQDESARLTIHLSEAHGVGSQDLGQLEVMIGRTLNQDDSRGVEEALKDGRTVKTIARIQLETDNFCRFCSQNDPTSLANRLNLDLNNPITVLSTDKQILPEGQTETKQLERMTNTLPCNTHLLLMKPVTLKKNETKIGLLLHKFGADCDNKDVPSEGSSNNECLNDNKIKLPKFLMNKNVEEYTHTTFNFVSVLKRVNKAVPLELKAKKIVALTVDV